MDTIYKAGDILAIDFCGLFQVVRLEKVQIDPFGSNGSRCWAFSSYYKGTDSIYYARTGPEDSDVDYEHITVVKGVGSTYKSGNTVGIILDYFHTLDNKLCGLGVLVGTKRQYVCASNSWD